jgi:hypothetical protein
MMEMNLALLALPSGISLAGNGKEQCSLDKGAQ